MTARFKQILEQLNALATLKVDKSMSDADFSANVEAINLLCNTFDDLGVDSKGIRKGMNVLYPEFLRRINEKQDIQLAMPLIKALYNFIYGRENDRGQKRWRDTLTEMCGKIVDSYRKNPAIDSTEYLFALDIVSRLNGDNENPDIKEYKETIARYLEDIDGVSLAEKIRRVRAYERSRLLFIPAGWEKWTEINAIISNENPSGLDDETFIIWREISDLAPMKELKKRSENSRRMQLEYLQGCIFTEFAKENELKAKRKLAKDLKTLNDDIIGDIIPVKIIAEMSVATLHALEIIYGLRLQLAQLSWEDKESIYEEMCISRFEQIAKALRHKYKTAESLNEKIEILERLSGLGQQIHSDDADFAIDEADKLKQIPDPTYSQRLRLDWIPNIEFENESQIVEELLPNITPSRMEEAVFDMGTLALISDYVTAGEREAIFNRFTAVVNAAIASTDAQNLSKLLTLAASWNSSPRLRSILNGLYEKAAEVYRNTEKANGKTEEASGKAEKALNKTNGVTNLDSALSDAKIILRLNPIAAALSSRLAALSYQPAPLDIPA